MPLGQDPYGRALVEAGVGEEALEEWAEDPVVTFEGAPQSVFGLHEDLDAGPCLRKAAAVYAADCRCGGSGGSGGSSARPRPAPPNPPHPSPPLLLPLALPLPGRARVAVVQLQAVGLRNVGPVQLDNVVDIICTFFFYFSCVVVVPGPLRS